VSEAATATPSASAVDEGFRVVQRLVLPADQELDVQSLYVSGITSFSSGGDSTRQSGGDYESAAEETEDDEESEAEAGAGMSGFGRITDASGAPRTPDRAGDATAVPED
jgi:hypothetical protein